MGTVMVTGGAGFIGSHTVELLVDEGYDVIVVDNLSSGSWSNLAGLLNGPVKLVKVDVASWTSLWSRLKTSLRDQEIDGIIHLAAVVSIVEARRRPWKTLRVNVEGVANILEAARRLDIERIIFASSAAVYGEPRQIPIAEDHELMPMNLYGETKLMGERLLWRYMEDYGLKPIALRYFNVYGPKMRPGPYSGVVYKFISAVASGSQPIIYGDGRQTRDFIYVRDVASANRLALESRYTGPVNIGSGRETSVLELYRIICRLAGRCMDPVFRPPRKGDISRSTASIGLAYKVLGWRPVTSLEEGLKATIKYYIGQGAKQ
ncbi:MAG: SDR family NAD(P)-dependent oxidoreductase [Desulfurococcales archaeon]|nr:SDR family NAD(P)-dependent oxidoreductase [Desulfurococcales archaeon]